MKCGPDACPIVGFAALSPTKRRGERKRRAKVLRVERGFTEQQIAELFGVGQATISRDLGTLSEMDNAKGQGKDTLGRKRSPGRPRGSGKNGSMDSPKMVRNMFILQANAIADMAKYSGRASRHVYEAARHAADAWTELADQLQRRVK